MVVFSIGLLLSECWDSPPYNDVQGVELQKTGYNHEIMTGEASTPVVASKLIIKTVQQEDLGTYQVTVELDNLITKLTSSVHSPQ